MTSLEDREKRRKRMKRNEYAKELRLSRKYNPRIVSDKKTEYKRKHINIRNFEEELEDGE